MVEIFNFNNIVGVLINSFTCLYICSKISENKINYKGIKFYICNIVFAFLMILNYVFVNDVFRIIVMVLLMSVFTKILFNVSFKESIIIAFIAEIVEMIAELLCVVILAIVNNNINVLVDSTTPLLIINISVLLICIILMKIKIFTKICLSIIKITRNLNKRFVEIAMILCLVSINFIFLSMYYKYNIFYIILVNSLISTIYLFICFKILNTESKYNKINNKYNNTLNSLREYEEILDVYRVSSHENKNQLLTIRSMIVKKEKNIPEYIDKIIDNNIKDDEKLMFDTNAIPAGGLRAVIYSKLLVMKDKKIKFNLNVDRKVRTVELIDLGEDLMLDVCKVIGVFLDNAIEAVLDLKKKNISINLFTDEDTLNIEISNNYKGDIDLTRIDDKGYTSKSDGHGYGLSLVKEIISKNKKLENQRKINKNIFTQNLKIKLKH